MGRTASAAGSRWPGRIAASMAAAAAAAGVAIAWSSSPWRDARAEFSAVQRSLGGPLPAMPASAPSAALDPRGRLDAWLAAEEVPPAARRAAALALDARGTWTRADRGDAAIDRWLRELAGIAANAGPAGATAAAAAAAAGGTLDESEWRLVIARLGDSRATHPATPASADEVRAAWLAAIPPPPRDRAMRAALLRRTPDDDWIVRADAAFARADARTARLRHLALEGVASGLEESLLSVRHRTDPAPVAAALLVRLATVDPWRLVAAVEREAIASSGAAGGGTGGGAEAGAGAAVASIGTPRDPALSPILRLAPADAVSLALALAGDRDPACRPGADRLLAARASSGCVHAARQRWARPWSAAFRAPPAPEALLTDADPEAGLRATIAAGRRPETLPAGLADRLLDDPGVPPALVALLVDARGDEPMRSRLAAAWMRSFDDRRKQAGAILVALHRPASSPLASDPVQALVGELEAAHRAEDRGIVRRIQRLALAAHGRAPAEGPSPAMLRATAPADQRPVLALLGGLAGDCAALAALTELPDGADGATVALLDAAIARLVPHWTARVGRTIGGGTVAPRLQRDRLEARRLVEAGSLRFDPGNRRFEPDQATAGGATATAGLPAAARAPMIEP